MRVLFVTKKDGSFFKWKKKEEEEGQESAFFQMGFKETKKVD